MKGFYTFEQSAHSPMFEEPEKMQKVLREDVLALGGRGYHSLAIKSDGSVWAWGFNSDGQLGDGTTRNSSEPVQVIGLSKKLFLPYMVR